MTLPPKFYASHAVPKFTELKEQPHVVDIYVDYTCPFSAKFFINWYENLYPKLEMQYHNKVQIVFHNYVQVWHPTSNLLHEAGLVVAQLDPDWFLEASYHLFKDIQEYYDTATAELSRNEIYSKIFDVSIGPNNPKFTKDQFLEKLVIKTTQSDHSNVGNAVTNDLKAFTRVGRQNGVHVTPTVLVNGFKDGSIESSTPIVEIEAKLNALL
jgi:protein-disulfide isomerase